MTAKIEYTYTYEEGKISRAAQCVITGTNLEIAYINPFRYRSYTYDQEIGMYYLQSRYYDPEVGRFINADEAALALVSKSPIDSNLFTYCRNNSIRYKDSSGYVALEFAVLLEIIRIFAYFTLFIVILTIFNTIINDPSFQRSWANFSTMVGNSFNSFKDAMARARKATIAWVSSIIATISLYLEIEQAKTRIKQKIKKNSKQRYWAASIPNVNGYTYVIIHSAISYKTALGRIAVGKSVFTITKSEARTLAYRYPPIRGPEKGKKKNSPQYWHYHPANKNAHIFYLF